MEESPYPRYLPSAVTTTHELAFVSLVVSTEQQYSNRLFASCPWHNIVALNTTRKKNSEQLLTSMTMNNLLPFTKITSYSTNSINNVNLNMVTVFYFQRVQSNLCS